MARWLKLDREIDFVNPFGKTQKVSSVCVEGPKGEAEVARIATILSNKSLPYPADPRIRTNEDACPSFCLRPAECQGRSCCPRSYACDD